MERKLQSGSTTVNFTKEFHQPTARILEELKQRFSEIPFPVPPSQSQSPNSMSLFNNSHQVSMSNVNIQMNQSYLDAKPLQEQLNLVLRTQRVQTSVLFAYSGHK
ncbi:hypothetical protein CPB83DRAFT_845711 [Crepidotus variabilis]|uniref:Uncharacterized protein n=1 Tax=Crepidotus variabilis TaxID=179855 RepID=A0A9P6ERT8_9AGAR|nr:hypothetical protein CPB83DRAFT_845711 [Crepidotus variabilis]